MRVARAPDTKSSGCLRVESLDRPRVTVADIEQPVVQAVGTAEPELDAIGDEPESTPELGTRHRLVGEAALDLAILFLEHLAGRQRRALVGGPRAELAAARPPTEVGVRFGCPQPFHPPLDPDLFFERVPVHAQGR